MEDEELISLLESVDSKKKEVGSVAGSEETGGRVAKAKKAKMLVMNNVKDLYYTSSSGVYAKIELNGHHEIVKTDSKLFKNWLIFLFERTENAMLADSDIRTVISSVESIAFFRGKHRDVYLRIAEVEGKIFLDLCNEKRQVLEISADGFKVLEESPVLFRRTEDMDEIPIPIFENTSDYMRLSKYINFDKLEDLNMIVAFIMATFRPTMPKPILNLTGEAGSGKSTNSRVIRKFTDPAKQKNLLKKEIDMKELPLAAANQYLLAFDNLSGISKEGSDLLCVVSTGGVMTARKLYTNSEEEIVDLKKAVILNGIDEISKRQDLVSRSLFVDTPKLKDEDKRTEDEIWKAFESDYPYILGSLVNAVSCGLKNKGNDVSSYPRMMDFGRFIADCSPALDWDEGYWQTIYTDNQTVGVEQSIESDPFAAALVEMMEQAAKDTIFLWQGTSSELLKALSDRLSHEDTIYNKAWPRYNQVKNRLRRISPSIATKGITWEERKTNGKQMLEIFIVPGTG